jgi:3-isopropylmalate/(R)-2-methylmalate dehydratase small subunit
MEKSLKKRGYCHVFGDHISLDEGIMPFKFAIERVTDPEKLIPHLFKSTDPEFPNKVKPGDFVIGGQEFACGKPHVQGFIAMAALNLSVICESMPYKAMRRAVSVGLPLLTGCNPGADFVKNGDELEVDFQTGEAKNLTRGTSTRLPAMSPILRDIFVNGGMNGALAAWLKSHPEQAEGEPVVLVGAKGVAAVQVKVVGGKQS